MPHCLSTVALRVSYPIASVRCCTVTVAPNTHEYVLGLCLVEIREMADAVYEMSTGLTAEICKHINKVWGVFGGLGVIVRKSDSTQV